MEKTTGGKYHVVEKHPMTALLSLFIIPAIRQMLAMKFHGRDCWSVTERLQTCKDYGDQRIEQSSQKRGQTNTSQRYTILEVFSVKLSVNRLLKFISFDSLYTKTILKLSAHAIIDYLHERFVT